MTEKEVLEKIASRWDLLVSGKPKEYTFDSLKELIDSIDPGGARDWIKKLQIERYIAVQSSGNWIMTDKFKKLIPSDRLKNPNRIVPIVSSESNWKDFRILLEYYIECVKAEDKHEIYFDASKDGKEFFCPKPFGSLWLQSLTSHLEKRTFNIQVPASKISVMSSLLDDQLYLGYPLYVHFDENGEAYRYTPLAMVPVKAESYSSLTNLPGSALNYEVSFDFENASYNFEWVRDNVDGSDFATLLDMLDQIADGKFDMAKGLHTILSFSDYNKWYEEEFDPDSLDQAFPKIRRKGRGRRGLFNTVIFFRMQASVYNRSLLKELNAILKMSAEDLDKTSLAYIFRKPTLPNNKDNKTSAIPFIKSNAEQLDAVKRAFQYHLSELQGPPGTGKSQTAINLIANCVYRGNSVVFSSRNHAALDAIRNRSIPAIKNSDFPLIHYCKDEDRTIDWFSIDTKAELDSVLNEFNPNKAVSYNSLETAIEALYVIEEKLKHNDDLKEVYLASEEEYSRTRFELESKLSETEKYSWTDDELLKIGKASELVLASQKKGLINSIIRLFKKKKYEEVFSYLRTMNVVHEYLGDEYLITFAKSYLNLFNAYKEADKNKKQKSIEYEKEADKKDYLGAYSKAMGNMEKNKDDAFFFPWGLRLKDWDEDKLSYLQKGMNLAQRSKSTYMSKKDAEQIENSIKELHTVLPAWAVSLLSASHVAPLMPAVFDYAIIDESSLCDIASIIPLLFRAKDAVIIGDPAQFRPIVTMSPRRHQIIWNKYFKVNSEWSRYDYFSHTAYDIASYSAEKGMLKEHFRSNDEIANFYNDVFYSRELRIRTREHETNFPSVLENKEPFQWIDISDGHKAEIEEAVKIFEKIHNSGYTGKIGIISPLRKIVNEIALSIYSKGYNEKDVKINTSYGFQGGECDTIIFVVSYNKDTTSSQKNYLCGSANSNIYNVTVSRAMACFIAIGDRERCKTSGSIVLKRLATYPKTNEAVKESFASPLEKKLYEALQQKGIETEPQRYCLGYFLDLAYMDDNIMLDIEIDGSMHFNMDGTRKERDYRRDYAVQKEGWKPIRFLSSDVINDLDGCVGLVEAEIERGKNLRKRNQKNN